MSEPVTAYSTVVVGTDGSQSSLRAVARAGALAGACGATLVGRLLGSVPADATRGRGALIVHTTD
ncbi:MULTISPECIES: universal stress protein [unclassified Blastococcus]